MRRRAVLSVGNQTSTSYLAYLASRSIFFPHESAGRGAYLSFLSQSAFFFREMRRQAGPFPILPQ